MDKNRLESILFSDKSIIAVDVFIETTGSTGAMANYNKYGKGCAMCILRCPSFGSRVSISEKCGIKDLVGERADGKRGAMSGSCEKSGFFVGYTEVIATGTLAGYNAARYIKNEELLELPRELVTGDIIAYSKESVKMSEMSERHTFSGSVYFERMKALNLYRINKAEIKERVEKLNLTNIFKA